ncbi:hypothetical protein [Cryomorpha ignava]|nr:hypothetical protein [Cryomorpha ignava]
MLLLFSMVFFAIGCNSNQIKQPKAYPDCLEKTVFNSEYLNVDTVSFKFENSDRTPNLSFFKYDDYRGFEVMDDRLFTEILDSLKMSKTQTQSLIKTYDAVENQNDSLQLPNIYNVLISNILVTQNHSYALLSAIISVTENQSIECYFVFSYSLIIPE